LHDQHVCGLFSQDVWTRLLREVGYTDVRMTPLIHPDVEPGAVDVFVAKRPLA
jgi:hypothetical protein